MTDEEKEVFIKSLSERLTEQQRQISKAVIDGDMEKLEQLSIETKKVTVQFISPHIFNQFLFLLY